ncbi:MAG: radical SAM protein [Deltaproteobacteria bacterium]|nr:MAG: radical SAM protein [Deltaproteobacteria bacterium]
MHKTDARIDRIEAALSDLSGHTRDCHLCPRQCHVDRERGAIGYCGVGTKSTVSHSCLHFGEEPCLSGYYDYKANIKTGTSLSGSGTVFFAGCNLKCSFCQNYQISWQAHGSPLSCSSLASVYLRLQKKTALNINLVTPTHAILPILESLKRALEQGLHLPIVYNTGAYDSYETIARLAGIIDVYLPDFKYMKRDTSIRFSRAPDYPERAAEAIKEMYRQVGDLELDDTGHAKKGLIVRHLILPGCSDESCAILEWLATRISTEVCVSLMSQFRPSRAAPDRIGRGIFREEYDAVLSKVEELGFENVYFQPFPFNAEDHLVPDFHRDDPFCWDKVNQGS